MNTVYFAYGSNLDLADAQNRGLADGMLTPVMAAKLPDNHLVFDRYSATRAGGVLNIRERRGCFVSGYLFELSPAGLRWLDRKEGFRPDFPNASGYLREKVYVIGADGAEYEAVTYRVPLNSRSRFVKPSREYIAICRSGREAMGVDACEVERAAQGNPFEACANVFVYGTLMAGEANAASWEGFARLCDPLPAKARGALYDHGAYPGLAPGGDGIVTGEILRFENIAEALGAFDSIEGFQGFGCASNLFRRTLVQCDVTGAQTIAWAYTACATGRSIIKSGDWRVHRRL